MKVNVRPLGLTTALCLSTLLPCQTKAQNKVEASVGVDFVSGYVWRGQDLGGMSLQPSIGLEYKGFSFKAWGSAGVERNDTKEIDLTVGYSTHGFSFSITDYWVADEVGYFQYEAHNTKHVFELQAGYDFGLLNVNWYTNFAGADGVNAHDKRAYSSYLSLAAPFQLGGLEWTAEVGATPWATTYYNNWSSGFAVCDLNLSAAKKIRFTDSFALPLMAKASFNPCTQDAFFIVGLTF